MNTNSIPETQIVKTKDETRIYPAFGGTLDSKDHTRDIFLWPENHVVYKNPIYIGTAKPGDNAYNLFALPEGHVVYVVSKEEDDNEWSRREEHVTKTEVWIGEGECAMYVYTKEHGAQSYLWEDRAFMTTYGADAKVLELNDKLGIKLEAKNFMFNIENYLL